MGYPGSVYVQSYFDGNYNVESLISGARNSAGLDIIRGGDNKGYVRTRFQYSCPLPATDIETGQTVHIMGIPVIGVTLMRFTNNNVQPGTLAQYGFAYPLKTKKRIFEP